MKGHATIELRNIKTGEITKLEEDNLVTNFAQEYFKDFGPLKGPATDYSIANMIGGLLLFAETLPEDPDCVILPAGKTMIGNASIGTISNDAVTEMGSYVETESGWVDDLTYVQVYEFATNQANGRISSACLVPKIWGFYGEGNSISNTFKTTKYQGSDRDSLNIGSTYWHSYNSMGSNSKILQIDVENNKIICTDLRLLWNGGTTDTQLKFVTRIPRQHFYFPFKELQFRYGYPGYYHRVATDYIELPDAYHDEILSETKTAGSIIIDSNGSHFCICPASSASNYSSGGYMYLRSDSRTIYATHISGDSISMEKVPVPDVIYNELRGTSGSVAINTYCNANKMLITNTALSPTYGYIIDLSTQNYVRIALPSGNQMGRGIGYTTDNVWYFAYMKLDLTLNKAWPMNGGVPRQNIGRTDTYYVYPDKFYGGYSIPVPAISKLATIYTGDPSSSSGYITANTSLARSGKFLATINNLSTPIVKTSDMVMRITYRVTF